MLTMKLNSEILIFPEILIFMLYCFPNPVMILPQFTFICTIT